MCKKYLPSRTLKHPTLSYFPARDTCPTKPMCPKQETHVLLSSTRTRRIRHTALWLIVWDNIRIATIVKKLIQNILFASCKNFACTRSLKYVLSSNFKLCIKWIFIVLKTALVESTKAVFPFLFFNWIYKHYLAVYKIKFEIGFVSNDLG